MITLQQILTYAVKHGASDVHLTVGSPPAVRVDGNIRFIGEEILHAEDTNRFLDDLMKPDQKAKFYDTGDADVAHSVPGLGRFRVNIMKQRGSVGIVMRHVKAKIPNFTDLNLPVASMAAPLDSDVLRRLAGEWDAHGRVLYVVADAPETITSLLPDTGVVEVREARSEHMLQETIVTRPHEYRDQELRLFLGSVSPASRGA